LICDFGTANGDENMNDIISKKRKEDRKESRQRNGEIHRAKSNKISRIDYLPFKAERQLLKIDESLSNLHS